MNEGDAPPPDEEELPQNRCPSCGKPLKRVAGHAESYCEAEKLFVEVVRKPALDASRPPLVRADVLAATKRTLKELGVAYGLRTSGSKTDVLTRILRYMDEHGIDLPPEEIAEAEHAAPSGPAPPVRTASVDDLLAEIEEVVQMEPRPEPREAEPERAAHEPAPEVPSEVEPAPEPAERPVAEAPEREATAEAVEETAAEPLPEPAVAVEGVVEEELAAEPEPEAAAEAPEEAAPENESMAVAPKPIEEATAEETEAVAGPLPAFSAARLRRDRRRFYVGIVLVALGGPGLVVGSFLHDLLRVPWVGQTYDAFGPLNVLAASIGGVLLLGGLVAIGLGLRGGILRSGRASGV